MHNDESAFDVSAEEGGPPPLNRPPWLHKREVALRRLYRGNLQGWSSGLAG